MKYSTYLKNKILSKITINIYLRNSQLWLNYLSGNKANKTLFVKYIKKYSTNHSANSTRLMYASIMQYTKYTKNWKLVHQFQDIKLPIPLNTNKTIITLEEYEIAKLKWNSQKWIDSRNWLVFSCLFLTGIRAHELNQINKKHVINNQIKIIGKGNKERIVYVPNYLQELLNKWKPNLIHISKTGKKLTYKQINLIVKQLGTTLFNKNITCHSLRRSYATNVLRKNVDLKTVANLLGHSSINTTSRYLQLTTDEIMIKVKEIFN